MKVRILKMIWSGAKSAAKAGKVAKHNRKAAVLAEKYSEAKRFVSSISDDTWAKMSAEIFESSNKRTPLLNNLDNLRGFCKKYDFELPDDVTESVCEMERKASVFAERMNVAKMKGKTPQKVWQYGTKFQQKPEMKSINNYLDNLQNSLMSQWNQEVFHSIDGPSKDYMAIFSELSPLKTSLGFLRSSDLFDPRIGKVADDLINTEQVFYHGTTKARSIAKKGFSVKPKAYQAAESARELGEGVYITPNKKVASWHAGLRGSILPLKIDAPNIAVVNNVQQEMIINSMRNNLGEFTLQRPAHMELVMKQLFQRNGYNAAYSMQALGNGLFGDITRKVVDISAGGKQSQLVVFDPSNIQILPKTISERIANHSLQFKTVVECPVNICRVLSNYLKNS